VSDYEGGKSLRSQVLIFAVIVLLLVACTQEAAAPHPETLLPAPSWTLVSANGESVDFPPANGRPALLLFWATWCPYCKAFMPHVQSILDEFPNSGLVVYAISFKDDGDPAAVVERQGFDFLVLPNGEAVAEAYGVKTTPGLLLVDAAGMIRFDLRDIQAHEAMRAISAMDLKNSGKAARKAPYYAAALRMAVDQLFAESSSP
jgi:thiol-disulfide isomerase/thioredoxin